MAGPEALQEGAGRAGLQRDHRRAVRDEERGHVHARALEHHAGACAFCRVAADAFSGSCARPLRRTQRGAAALSSGACRTPHDHLPAPARPPSGGRSPRASWLRDFRAGELRLLALAVTLAVAALTAVGFFADRLNGGLTRDARQLLGGDAVVGSDQPAPPEARRARRVRSGCEVATQRRLSEHGARPGRKGGATRLVAVKAVAPAIRCAASCSCGTAPTAPVHARRSGARAAARPGSTPALLDALRLAPGRHAAARRCGAAHRPASSSSSPTAAPASRASRRA